MEKLSACAHPKYDGNKTAETAVDTGRKSAFPLNQQMKVVGMSWGTATARKMATGIVAFLLFASGASLRGQEEKPPEPEEVELQTKDGLRMQATYYGQKADARAVPVILLHDFKATRNAFAELAPTLQSAGFAVIAPDLRGHGASTKIQVNGRPPREVGAARLSREDIRLMIRFDMEAVRRFLVEKNDSEDVNLNKLCLIGAEMGASVALNWAAADWLAPPLAVGKQGQDVKALVLLSPPWSFKGVPVKDALQTLLSPRIRDNISWLILVGEGDSRAANDARKVFRSIERWYSEPDPSADNDGKSLYFIERETGLQGTKLLRAGGDAMQKGIARFIELRCGQQDFPWTRRLVGRR